MGNGMDPAEEYDRPGGSNVKGDVLVKLDNAVQRRLARKRNKCTANRKEDESDIEVENERRSSVIAMSDAFFNSQLDHI